MLNVYDVITLGTLKFSLSSLYIASVVEVQPLPQNSSNVFILLSLYIVSLGCFLSKSIIKSK